MSLLRLELGIVWMSFTIHCIIHHCIVVVILHPHHRSIIIRPANSQDLRVRWDSRNWLTKIGPFEWEMLEIFAPFPQVTYMLWFSQKLPHLQSQAIALLWGWQVCSSPRHTTSHQPTRPKSASSTSAGTPIREVKKAAEVTNADLQSKFSINLVLWYGGVCHWFLTTHC